MQHLRPEWHFMPAKNWMNDPNGLIYLDNRYHMFYQYNPNQDRWGDIHWGHAWSRDLLHWEHLPVALRPSPENGETHCFSGSCAVDGDGVPTLFYTSIGEGGRNAQTGALQWRAQSRDGLMTWKKDRAAFLTPAAHRGLSVTDWRDPYVLRIGSLWYCVVGGSARGRGCALLYRSEDTVRWEFMHILAEGTEPIWECPNFFPLNGRYVLLYSPSDIVRYRIGDLDESTQFVSAGEGTVDASGWQGFYAPQTFEANGRRLMFGWLTEESRGNFRGIHGWSGVQSLPRELRLQDGRLCISPAGELALLRGSCEKVDPHTLKPQTRSRSAEIEIAASGGSSLRLNVLMSPDEREQTGIVYDGGTRTLTVDRSRSSLFDTVKTPLSAKVESAGPLRLRVFIDHSTVEVCANGTWISTRVYPAGADSDGISLICDQKPEAFTVWQLQL